MATKSRNSGRVAVLQLLMALLMLAQALSGAASNKIVASRKELTKTGDQEMAQGRKLMIEDSNSGRGLVGRFNKENQFGVKGEEETDDEGISHKYDKKGDEIINDYKGWHKTGVNGTKDEGKKKYGEKGDNQNKEGERNKSGGKGDDKNGGRGRHKYCKKVHDKNYDGERRKHGHKSGYKNGDGGGHMSRGGDFGWSIGGGGGGGYGFDIGSHNRGGDFDFGIGGGGGGGYGLGNYGGRGSSYDNGSRRNGKGYDKGSGENNKWGYDNYYYGGGGGGGGGMGGGDGGGGGGGGGGFGWNRP